MTYPFIAMPLAAKMWGASLPLTHYLRILLQQALRGAPPQASALGLLTLLCFVVFPPLLCIRRLKRIMQDPNYWGHL